jgi:hypothetical protein
MDPPFVLRSAGARILIERLLRLLAACERLIGGAHVLVCCVLLVDGRLGGVVLGAFGVRALLVDLGRILVREPCALVGARGAQVGVRGVLTRRRDRIWIH